MTSECLYSASAVNVKGVFVGVMAGPHTAMANLIRDNSRDSANILDTDLVKEVAIPLLSYTRTEGLMSPLLVA